MGVDCHVIIPENPSYYVVDEELKDKIPNDITLHKVRINDITRFIKKVKSVSKPGNIKQKSNGLISCVMGWIRANYFIPDPKVNWVKPVIKKATEIIEHEQIDLIFTNGSPHSVHLSGVELKKKFDVKWIADFRDPWTGMDYFENLNLSTNSLKKHQTLEKKVITSTDLTLTVSPTWEEDFKKLGATKTAFITNGFDEIIDPIKIEQVYISHIGSIHDDRSIKPIISYIQSSNQACKLLLVGDVSEKIRNEVISVLPEKKYKFTGNVSHNEAKKWIAKSKILLLPINQAEDSNGRIPAKLFEYIASGKSILLLGNTNGDAAQILDTIENTGTFEYDKVEEIHKFIDSQISISNPNQNHANIAKFDRKELAKELYIILKKMVIQNKE